MIRLPEQRKGQPGKIAWLPFLFLFLCGQAAAEVRAVWVVRHEVTTPEGVAAVVDRAREAGMNTLFVQVRGRGDAYYDSELAPAGESVNPGFDPLAACISAARADGIAVHAWVNVYLAWYVDRPAPEDHLLSTHPEWFMISQDGVDLGQPSVSVDLVGRGVEGRYLSPSHPGVSRHLKAVVREIMDNYDVAGIHLDYVRYPNEHYDFSPLAQAAYWEAVGQDPPPAEVNPADRKVWNRWRSDRVTAFVRELRRLIDAARPGIQLSAAVKPDLTRAYVRYGQDWVHWINRRYLDFAVPMFYTGSTDEIETQMRTVRKYVQKGRVCAGLGAWNQAAQATFDQIDAGRRSRLDGFSIFSFATLASSPALRQGLRQRLGEGP